MYSIGTKFIRRGTKRRDVETIVDIHTTYNSKNEVVSVKYVTEHVFMGQKVINQDVPAATIARGHIFQG